MASYRDQYRVTQPPPPRELLHLCGRAIKREDNPHIGALLRHHHAELLHKLQRQERTLEWDIGQAQARLNTVKRQGIPNDDIDATLAGYRLALSINTQCEWLGELLACLEAQAGETE